jgi:hypothetical protein
MRVRPDDATNCGTTGRKHYGRILLEKHSSYRETKIEATAVVLLKPFAP